MSTRRWLLLLCVWVLSAQVLASSQTQVSVGGGVMHHEGTAVESDWQLNFRSGNWFGVFNPSVELEVVGKGHSYAWGGLSVEIPLGDRWVIRPGGALGFYMDDAENSISERLRSKMALSFDYKTTGRNYIGLGVHVISGEFNFSEWGDLAANVHYIIVL